MSEAFSSLENRAGEIFMLQGIWIKLCFQTEPSTLIICCAILGYVLLNEITCIELNSWQSRIYCHCSATLRI